MTTHDHAKQALLIVDVQQGLADPKLGKRNNPDAETNMAALLQAFRARGLPVIHICHDSVEPDSPLRPELPGNAIKSEVLPRADEVVLRKQVNSAFIGTDLESRLRGNGIGALVIVGLTTDHCVSATTRMASDLGFDVTLIADATAAFERRGHDGEYFSAETIHRVNLASLDREFCSVRSTGELLRQLT